MNLEKGSSGRRSSNSSENDERQRWEREMSRLEMGGGTFRKYASFAKWGPHQRTEKFVEFFKTLPPNKYLKKNTNNNENNNNNRKRTIKNYLENTMKITIRYISNNNCKINQPHPAKYLGVPPILVLPLCLPSHHSPLCPRCPGKVKTITITIQMTTTIRPNSNALSKKIPSTKEQEQ